MLQPSDTSDHRRDERLHCELSWAACSELEDDGNDQGFGALVDVSVGGLRIRTPQPPRRGSQVWLRANAGEEIVEVVATARWVNEIHPGLFEFGAEIADDEPGKDEFFGALTEIEVNAPGDGGSNDEDREV